MELALTGWDIGREAEIDWVPWDAGGLARAKTLASADGYYVVLVQAGGGYRGTPHEHTHAEFVYVVDGRLRTQGRWMSAGDAYAAAAGSTHTDFAVDDTATYLLVFRL